MLVITSCPYREAGSLISGPLLVYISKLHLSTHPTLVCISVQKFFHFEVQGSSLEFNEPKPWKIICENKLSF
jgi:hypothetical protein